MKKHLTGLLIFCAMAMNAQITQVSGNQCGVWGGEIHIIGDVTVPELENLRIEQGTKIIADGYFGITVLGGFSAEGNENARITFTVADTTGYSNFDDERAGAWQGIQFSKPGSVKLQYCDFSYGKTKIDCDGGAMRIYFGRDIEIANCTFHHNTSRRRGGAVYAENTMIYIHDCEVYDNFSTGYMGSYCWGVGFQFLKCDVKIHDIVFHDNFSDVAYGGGMNVESCNLELKNAVFYNNIAVNAGGLGIQRCKEFDVKVTNMLAYNNKVKHYGGGLAMATSDPELNNLTIVNNYCGGGGGAGMQTAFNACPKLNNCIFWGNHAIARLNETDGRDTIEYYMGSQIWLWGSDCYPMFKNGVVQYGLDSINAHEYMTPDQYVDMLEVDPLFVDEHNHDYRLNADSPCINTGVADTSGMFILDTDLAGGPRIFNGRIDMGCYEWNNINVNELDACNGTLFVYPNPLNDNALCVVNLNKKSNVVMRLVSLDGREVYRENCGMFESGENCISLDGMMKHVEKSNKSYLLIIDNQYIKIIY